jgi:hypothetical protein
MFHESFGILLDSSSACNVVLTNMKLKPEALNALKLPILVKAGIWGSVKLKVRIAHSQVQLLAHVYCIILKDLGLV